MRRLKSASLLSSLLQLAACGGTVDVLAGRNDDARTGANLQEALLTPELLKKGSFGKLWSYDVDGFVYAQPLVAAGVSTAYGPRNLLIVATTTNELYAFDSDHNAPNIVWHDNLTGSATLTEKEPLSFLAPSVGILSTPVIDKTTNTIYVVSRASVGTHHVQTLHQVSLDSGAVKNSVNIDGAVEVNGNRFDPENQINRPGLALANGLVIVLWGSFLDGELSTDTNVRGWVTAYDKNTLALKGIFCTTCYAGIAIGGMTWQSGRPPAVEAGRYVYFFTGNGWLNKNDKSYLGSCDPGADPAKPAGYFAESLIKLDTQEAEHWKDNEGFASWTPYDWCELDKDDADLGGSGPMLIGPPAPNNMPIVIGGGKAGVLYAIDAGKINRRDLVEWRSPSGTGGLTRFGSINECVDFERGVDSPSPFPFATIDVPADYPFPWAIPVSGMVGGEHGHIPITFRPLCAPLASTPGHIGWGAKQDGQLHHIMGGPVFLPSSSSGTTGTVYIAPEGLPIVAFSIQDGRIRSGPMISALLTFGVEERSTPSGLQFSQFVTTATASRHPGGILALSAAGNDLDSGIVWLSHFRDQGPGKGLDATEQIRDGVIEAFDATSLRLLWSSDGKLDDGVGYFQKFTPPTVANGKVYVAASPNPRSRITAQISVCLQNTDGVDRCLSYDQAASIGHVVVYGKLPRRWPWQARAVVRANR
jgi:hypothetical protein